MSHQKFKIVYGNTLGTAQFYLESYSITFAASSGMLAVSPVIANTIKLSLILRQGHLVYMLI
jgi:hypothetical protein